MKHNLEDKFNIGDFYCHEHDVHSQGSYRRKVLIALYATIAIVLIVVGVFILRNVWDSGNDISQNTAVVDSNVQTETINTPITATQPIINQSNAVSAAEEAIPETIKPIVVTVKAQDSLKKIFKRAGLSEKNAANILALKGGDILKKMRPGKKLSLFLDTAGNIQLQRLTYEISDLDTLVVTAKPNGKGWLVKTNHRNPTVTTKYVSGIINGSIYAAGKQVGLSGKLTRRFVNLLSSQVSAKNMRNGDDFALFYKDYTIDGKQVKDSEIVAAELLHGGKTYQIIGFTDPHGITDFYTPDGRSIKPSFIRYPVSFKRVGSRFSMSRMHPILGVVRPHWGVDFSAKFGTPIVATSNGRIAFAGGRSGYGRAVIMRQGIYSTLYAHLSRFAYGVYAGKYVKQGDVIGYVGSSGLSTSPHVHYELHVHGVPKDPLKVRLPTGEMVPAPYRNRFFALSKKVLMELDIHRMGNKVFAMYTDAKFE